MARKPSRVRKPVLTARQRLHVAGALAGFLIVAWCTWVVIAAQWSIYSYRHGFGGWVCHRVNTQPWRTGSIGSTVIAMRVFRRTLSGWSYVGGMHKDKSAATLKQLEAGGEYFGVYASYTAEPAGLWGATRAAGEGEVHACPVSGTVFPDQSMEVQGTPELRRVFFDAVRREEGIRFPESVSDMVRTGKWQGIHFAWTGYALNVATVLGLGMWVWFTPIAVRDIWRWRKARRGGCTRCGYDVSGLRSDAAVCPECGAALVRDAGDPGAPGPATPR